MLVKSRAKIEHDDACSFVCKMGHFLCSLHPSRLLLHVCPGCSWLIIWYIQEAYIHNNNNKRPVSIYILCYILSCIADRYAASLRDMIDKTPSKKDHEGKWGDMPPWHLPLSL